MKFEEILPLMREGKKAQTDHDRAYNAYWMCADAKVNDYWMDDIPAATHYTVIRINEKGEGKFTAEIFLLLVMDESWEVMEDK
jgi:hypothetical protein